MIYGLEASAKQKGTLMVVVPLYSSSGLLLLTLLPLILYSLWYLASVEEQQYGAGQTFSVGSSKILSRGFLLLRLSQNLNGKEIKGILQLLYEQGLKDSSLWGGEGRGRICLKFAESQRRAEAECGTVVCQIPLNEEYEALVEVNQ